MEGMPEARLVLGGYKNRDTYLGAVTVKPLNKGHLGTLKVYCILYLEVVQYTNVLVWRRTKSLYREMSFIQKVLYTLEVSLYLIYYLPGTVTLDVATGPAPIAVEA